MKRVVILGPGGAGKSTLARQLGERLGLPIIELDKHFWSDDLTPLSKGEWGERLSGLTQSPMWIMDGDLGPYDVLEPRLRLADTVVLLDFPRWRCVLRSIRRSSERLDYWKWILTWRRRSRPLLVDAIARDAKGAVIEMLSNPRAVDDWLRRAVPSSPGHAAP